MEPLLCLPRVRTTFHLTDPAHIPQTTGTRLHASYTMVVWFYWVTHGVSLFVPPLPRAPTYSIWHCRAVIIVITILFEFPGNVSTIANRPVSVIEFNGRVKISSPFNGNLFPTIFSTLRKTPRRTVALRASFYSRFYSCISFSQPFPPPILLPRQKYKPF